MDFIGKNAIITGGSSGIGKATAKLLAREAANVFIVARNRERLDQALLEIEAERVNPDQRFEALSADVTNYAEVEASVAAIADNGGSPDLLINSAGIARPGYFEELPLSEFREQMETNYLGTLHAVKAVVPYMIAQGGGHIVNISSVAGAIGVFGYTAYGASKFAVRGFSEVLRIELKPHNIGVSVVIPNDTDTPQLHQERELKCLETEISEGCTKPENLSRPREFLAYWLVRLINSGGEPLAAEDVAAAIMKGVRRGRYLIAPDPLFGLAYRLRGFVIPLANWAFDQLVPLADREEREREEEAQSVDA